jgi:hypothetical protein
VQLVSDFARLRRTASRRLILLRVLADTCGRPITPTVDRRVAFITIEALNLWASFVRSYYLSCAVMQPLRESGARITIGLHGVHNADDAIAISIMTLKPRVTWGPPWSRNDEPAWHAPGTLVALSRAIDSSNQQEINAAFGYPTKVFLHLPSVRNFFAHRNAETADKVANVARSYRLDPKLRPAEILCSAVPKRPQSLLSDWLDDLRATIFLLCQ